MQDKLPWPRYNIIYKNCYLPSLKTRLYHLARINVCLFQIMVSGIAQSGVVHSISKLTGTIVTVRSTDINRYANYKLSSLWCE